jgi:hypothetical protein
LSSIRKLGPTRQAFREQAGASDVDALIQRAREMGDILAEIAIEQQLEDPATASRAAIGSARAAADILGGMIVQEQLEELKGEVAKLRQDREQGQSNGQGRMVSPDGSGRPMVPHEWGAYMRDLTKRAEEGEFDETESNTVSEGSSEQGGSDGTTDGGDAPPKW